MKKCLILILFAASLLVGGCSKQRQYIPTEAASIISETKKGTEDTELKTVPVVSEKPANETAATDVIERHKLISVPNINQNPTLPTGCETTAAVMVLQYYKEDISIRDFAEYCLPKSNDFYRQDWVLYGPDPWEYFVGDPFSQNGYGCFSSVIVDAVNSNSRLCRADRVDGSLEELCRRYIDKDKPLLIWATMDMKPTKQGDSWLLPNGERFVWPAGEHCLVLVGYDADYYYFNDPLKGETVGYKKETAGERYVELGSQAVLISAYN